MSIYATLWEIGLPDRQTNPLQPRWVRVTAQGVPSYAMTADCEWLPPPVANDFHEEKLRAVVFVTDQTPKGTRRSGQEYVNPLLVLSGEEYEKITFKELLGKLVKAAGCDYG